MTSLENVFEFVIPDDDSNEVDGSADLEFIKECKQCPTVYALLNHGAGSKSFLRYLKETNTTYYHMFRFIYCCKRLDRRYGTNYEERIEYIYRTFIVKRLFPIPERILHEISWRIQSYLYSPDIFNKLCIAILNTLDKDIYSSFLSYQLQNVKILSRANATRSEHNCKRHALETYSSESQECSCKITCRSSKKNMVPEPESLAKKLEEFKNKSEKNEKSKENEKLKNLNFNQLQDILQNMIVYRSEDGENILDDHIDKVWPDNTILSEHDYHDDSNLNPESNSNNKHRSHSIPLNNYANQTSDNLASSTIAKHKEKDKNSLDSGFDTGSVYSSQTSTLENTINRSIAQLCLKDRNEDFISHNAASNQNNELRCGAPDAMASRRSSFIMNSSGHNYYKQRPAPYRSSFSNDSYAHVEEMRLRDLKNELRRKIRSPSWIGAGLKCGKNKTEISNESDSYTIALCQFSDETIPYRVKIRGSQITLAQLKATMPKRGNYRYFFITQCEELKRNIQEEITEDDRILPMWEGRVDARIFAVK